MRGMYCISVFGFPARISHWCSLLLLCIPFALYSKETPNNKKPTLEERVEAQLKVATALWHKGDNLGIKARKAMLGKEATSSKEAIGLLEAQDAAYAEAEKQFRTILKSKEHPSVLAEFGRFLVARKRFAEAGLKIEMALMSPESKTAFTSSERSYLLRTFAGIQQRSGAIKRAVNLYQAAFDLNKDDPRSRISLAVCHCELNAYEEASNLLRAWASPAGLDLHMDDKIRALGLYTLAYAREMLGLPEEALGIYRRALSVAARNTRGVSEIEIQARGAIQRIRRFLKEAKSNAGLRERYAQAQSLCDQGMKARGQALVDQEAFGLARQAWIDAFTEAEQKEARELPAVKHMQEAMERFQEALRTYSGCSRAHLELARCHLFMNELSTARSHFEAASVYDPLGTGLLSELGTIHLMFGEWDKAQAVYKKLLSLDPEFAPAHLGMAATRIKQRENAKELFRALDDLERAERLGGNWRQTASLRHEARSLLAILSRDGVLPSLPKPAGSKQTPHKKAPPWYQGGTILDMGD